MIGIIFDIKTVKNTPFYKSLTGLDDRECNILFIVIDNNLFEELEEQTDRKAFINSQKFISGIEYAMCTIYNEKNDTISIETCDPEYIQLFINTIGRFFEDSIKIVASYDEGIIDKGFSNPVICGPSGEICLTKKNEFFRDADKKTVEAEYRFLVNHRTKSHCGLVLKLEKETKDFLEYITNAGVTKSGGTRSQKEFFGRFDIKNTETIGDETINTLVIDKSSLKSGEEDAISAKPSLYNFHSHPFSAYLKYRVNYGPPSSQDYKSIFILVTRFKTIVHFVASIEGLYVVSSIPENINMSQKEADVLIEKMDYDDVETVEELHAYIDRVNSVGLFRLKLIPWDSKEFSHIEVEFPKSGEYGNCLIRD